MLLWMILNWYKRKEDKNKYKKYKGIDLLSVIGKVFRKITIVELMKWKRRILCGRGCVYQIFVKTIGREWIENWGITSEVGNTEEYADEVAVLHYNCNYSAKFKVWMWLKCKDLEISFCKCQINQVFVLLNVQCERKIILKSE